MFPICWLILNNNIVRMLRLLYERINKAVSVNDWNRFIGWPKSFGFYESLFANHICRTVFGELGTTTSSDLFREKSQVISIRLCNTIYKRWSCPRWFERSVQKTNCARHAILVFNEIIFQIYIFDLRYWNMAIYVKVPCRSKRRHLLYIRWLEHRRNEPRTLIKHDVWRVTKKIVKIFYETRIQFSIVTWTTKSAERIFFLNLFFENFFSP